MSNMFPLGNIKYWKWLCMMWECSVYIVAILCVIIAHACNCAIVQKKCKNAENNKYCKYE